MFNRVSENRIGRGKTSFIGIVHSRSGVGEHAQRSRHLGEVSARYKRGSLVTDTELETGRTPVGELDGSLGLDGGDSGVDVLRNDVTSVEQAAGHVLALSGVALDHLVVRLEAGESHLSDRVGLVEGCEDYAQKRTRKSVNVRCTAPIKGERWEHLPLSAEMRGA